MKFIAIINREIPLSKALNGLAHMSFGMGHRLDADPDIHVYFAEKEKVRAFRTMAMQLKSVSSDKVVVSDFPHTMVGMSTDDLLRNVANTPEPEVTYFGACMAMDKVNLEMHKLLESCQQLKGYKPSFGQYAINVLPPQATDKYDLDSSVFMKISLLINQSNKISIAQIVNNIIISCLNLGRQVPISHQRLLTIQGTGDHAYGLSNISFHSLAVVTTKLFDVMSKAAQMSKDLTVYTHDQITIAFGTKANIEAVIPPKGTRLFSDNLKESELIDADKIENCETSVATSSFFSPSGSTNGLSASSSKSLCDSKSRLIM